MGVSILILTYNEAVNLEGCLDSVAFSDDVVVFDSYSTDRTVEIAQARGARVVQHRFENYGAQREAARRNVDYRYPWVLSLDADERVSPALAEELLRVTGEGATSHAAYRVRRKDHFQNRWIKHATLYPTWFTRLYRNDAIVYPERSVHEHPVVHGTVGALEGHLLHYSFNKGLTDWLEKHNKYSEMEAVEAIRELDAGAFDWGAVGEIGDPAVRRRLLKSLSYRMPFRPLLRFAYMYLLRRGFLDGGPGLTYCTLLGFYEYLIVQKMREMREKETPAR